MAWCFKGKEALLAEMRTFRLRVRYRKAGRLAMLSHLELTHALERMVRRSQLPFALTQGFSPHMKIAFGPALPVGVGGDEEVFDVTLTSYIAPAKAQAALARCAPADLAPQSCEYVETQAKAASVAFAVSGYEVSLSHPLRHLSVPSIMTVTRKGRERQLIPAEFIEESPVLTACGFTFSLRSRESGSLRADAFAQEFIQQSCDPDDPPSIIAFTRRTLR